MFHTPALELPEEQGATGGRAGTSAGARRTLSGWWPCPTVTAALCRVTMAWGSPRPRPGRRGCSWHKGSDSGDPGLGTRCRLQGLTSAGGQPSTHTHCSSWRGQRAKTTGAGGQGQRPWCPPRPAGHPATRSRHGPPSITGRLPGARHTWAASRDSRPSTNISWGPHLVTAAVSPWHSAHRARSS